MNRHRLIDYQKLNNTLVPDASLLGEIANTDWWTACSELFDDIIWQNYYDRTVLMNSKFPFDICNPEDQDNIDETTENILRSFAINLRSNSRKYEMMYIAFMSDFNPLYNVDGWEYEDRTLQHRGTDTTSSTGDDTLVKSGNQVLTKAGTEDSTRTGSEQLSHTGSDTSTTARTTDDSATFYDTEKTTDQPGVTDTTTYNQVKDSTSFNNRTDTTAYNNITDKTTYGKTDTNTKNLDDTEHIARRRYGNIGITKSTELLGDTFRYSEEYLNLFKRIVHDCVNTCTYMVE